MPEAYHLPRMGGWWAPCAQVNPCPPRGASGHSFRGVQLVGPLSHWSRELSLVGVITPWKLASAMSEQPPIPHLLNTQQLVDHR